MLQNLYMFIVEKMFIIWNYDERGTTRHLKNERQKVSCFCAVMTRVMGALKNVSKVLSTNHCIKKINQIYVTQITKLKEIHHSYVITTSIFNSVGLKYINLGQRQVDIDIV